ncbi:MAG: alpha-amylase family glycosyl hydrolase [Blastocatellia bacterium]
MTEEFIIRLTRKINYTAPVASHPADGLVCTQPLGAIYTAEQTTFRVWAPTANQITLHLYPAPSGDEAGNFKLKKNDDGSWETTVPGDLNGTYYTYTAAGNDPRFNPDRELLDPYAHTVTAHNGRSIVVHDATPVADRPTFSMNDAVIYELHVRDFTLDPDSGIQRRGKYLGFTEADTYLTNRIDITTGLDHLTELGVNVVQVMPVSEFHTNAAEDLYGWGYDVVHHFSPAGWYATERYDTRRVSELKRMIDALHKRGLRVTLDVVFNHTFELINKNLVFSFEGLVPGYYYRLRHDGSYWDGSGTGNEFRSEAPMARRYLVDCCKHWVTEYKVDGFRLDLLGLIDQETMLLIVDELRAIDPHLLVYGEPWGGGTSPIELTTKGKQWGRGWAVFNDDFRDALKGNVFDARAMGFIQCGNNVNAVKTGILGSVDSFRLAARNHQLPRMPRQPHTVGSHFD